jgi:hypothetical protein
MPRPPPELARHWRDGRRGDGREPVSFETADLSHLDAHRGFAAFVFTFGLGRRNPFTLIGAEQTNHDLADFDEDANRADDEARDKSPAPSARLP